MSDIDDPPSADERPSIARRLLPPLLLVAGVGAVAFTLDRTVPRESAVVVRLLADRKQVREVEVRVGREGGDDEVISRQRFDEAPPAIRVPVTLARGAWRVAVRISCVGGRGAAVDQVLDLMGGEVGVRVPNPCGP